MIVFDENIQQRSLIEEVAKWYKGKAISITTLRYGSLIKDDAITTLLRTAKQPTFITTNVDDFWLHEKAELAYCIICFELSNKRAGEIPSRLRKVFRYAFLKTKANRMGKILRVKHNELQFYQKNDNQIYTLQLWT